MNLHKVTQLVRVLCLNKTKRLRVEAGPADTGAKPSRISNVLVPSLLKTHARGPEKKSSTLVQEP